MGLTGDLVGSLITGLNGTLDQDFGCEISGELGLDSEGASALHMRGWWGWDAMMILRGDTCFCL